MTPIKEWWPRTRDFLRDVWVEMKKVSWPGRSEVVGTTVVVIVACFLFGFYLFLCAGGVILSTLLNHLAAIADETVHSTAFAVTLLDFGSRAPIGAFSGRRLTAFERRLSAKLFNRTPEGLLDFRRCGLTRCC